VAGRFAAAKQACVMADAGRCQRRCETTPGSGRAASVLEIESAKPLCVFLEHAAHLFAAACVQTCEPSVREPSCRWPCCNAARFPQCVTLRLCRTPAATGETQGDFAAASPIPGLASRRLAAEESKKGWHPSMGSQRRLHTCRPITTRILVITIDPVKLSLHENPGGGENCGNSGAGDF
jgi:hypothetical protein